MKNSRIQLQLRKERNTYRIQCAFAVIALLAVIVLGVAVFSEYYYIPRGF